MADETGVAEREAALRRVGRPWLAIAALLLLLLVIWLIGYVLLLLFAGLLLGVALTGARDALAGHLRLPKPLALLLVLLVAVASFAVGGWLLFPAMAEEADRLWQALTGAAETLRDMLDDYAWGRLILTQEAAPSAARTVAGTLAGAVFGAFGVLVNIVIVLFIGIYLAVAPGRYVAGVLRLVPIRHRARAAEVMRSIAHALRWWLVGQLVSMTTIGLLTAAGLWLLEVPQALMLALLAAIFTFIPYLGPVIAAVPAVLIAAAQEPMLGLYTLGLYIVVQSLEGYLITPLVLQRAVSLPPALTVGAQVLLGMLLGFAGLMLATPLAAAAMVAVRMLYVEDLLGDRAPAPGAARARAAEEEADGAAGHGMLPLRAGTGRSMPAARRGAGRESKAG